MGVGGRVGDRAGIKDCHEFTQHVFLFFGGGSLDIPCPANEGSDRVAPKGSEDGGGKTSGPDARNGFRTGRFGKGSWFVFKSRSKRWDDGTRRQSQLRQVASLLHATLLQQRGTTPAGLSFSHF